MEVKSYYGPILFVCIVLVMMCIIINDGRKHIEYITIDAGNLVSTRAISQKRYEVETTVGTIVIHATDGVWGRKGDKCEIMRPKRGGYTYLIIKPHNKKYYVY